MAFDTIMMEHDQLQMIADFNQSIIEAMMSFEDKKNNMRRQGYSETQILQEEDGFWGSIGKAYDKGKAAGSNSTWAGVKAGAAEFGRQLIKVLKNIVKYIKEAFVMLRNIFSSDKAFISRYQDDLNKVWETNSAQLNKLQFTINVPSRDNPENSTGKNVGSVFAGCLGLIQNIKRGVFTPTNNAEKQQLKANKAAAYNTLNTTNLTTDEATNLVSAYNDVKFNEKREVTVEKYLSGNIPDYPKGWFIEGKSLKELMNRFTNTRVIDELNTIIKASEDQISELDKKINSIDKDVYKSAMAKYRAAIAAAKCGIGYVTMLHKNDKKCLITLIAAKGKYSEAAMTLAKSFCEASDNEIDVAFGPLNEFAVQLENMSVQQLSGINESYSSSTVAVDPFESLS